METNNYICGGLPCRAVFGDLDKRAGVDNGGRFRALANTRSLDRHGTVFEPTGANLDAYRANPVILAEHSPYLESGHSPVVGKTLEISATKYALPFHGEFAPTELGNERRVLYAGGYMSAFSIRFDPDACKWRRERVNEKGKMVEAVVVKEWELREISTVAVPSNRESLIRAMASGVGGRAAYSAYAQACLLSDLRSRGADFEMPSEYHDLLSLSRLVARRIGNMAIDGTSTRARASTVERISESFADMDIERLERRD